MEGQGRKLKSVNNLISGMTFRVVSILTSFIVRTVFLKCLSNDYLSINGLYSSILSMLSLAELGFGTAMVYSMYKPLAEKDYEKLTQLMRLYKKTYRIIGTVVLVAGLCLLPFFDVLIKNKPDLPYLRFYYLLYLLSTVVSYWFYAYCNSIFHADQRASVISKFSIIFNLLRSTLQICAVVLLRNYTVFLLIQIFCTIAQNTVVALKAHKEYPVFSKQKNAELPKQERDSIFKDVKALMIQKVSFKVLNTSDSLLISSLVGVNWVGLLSNYLLIEEAVVAVLTQVLSAITASMGNFYAAEDRTAGYHLFRKIVFMNYWLYSCSAIALLVLLSPFITLWIGEDYVLSPLIVTALICRFFVEGYVNTMSAFRSTMGLFRQGKYFPLIVAGMKIVFSIVLSYPLGVAGILFATPLARCCINVWYMPLVIHRDGFKRSVRPFYLECFVCMILGAVIAIVMVIISHYLLCKGVTIFKFAALVIITACFPNLILFLVFRKTDELQYFVNLTKSAVRDRFMIKGNKAG